MRKIVFLIAVVWIGFTASAEVQLPKIFGDNMVLQRGKPVVIWGWSSPKEKVTVKLNNQTKTVKAGKDGKWKLSLDPAEAGGPYQLIVKGKNTITINNVMIGEVWICSGQSNMAFTVRSSNDAQTEISKADLPDIRHIKIPNTVASRPQADIPASKWEICSPETVGNFTAVGYFFARELRGEIDVPIGLINTSWGGTHVETWTSSEAFENSEEFQSMIASVPKLNMDSLTKKNAEAVIKRIEGLQGSLTKSKEVVEQWKTSGYNDSSWPKMAVPGLWEEQALGNFDGLVWFRKTILLTAANAGKEAILELGMVDDADETFVNGVKVGGINNYSEKRRYTIPAGTLKEGKNVIAVKVNDTGGGGGIYGEPGDIKISFGNVEESLAGQWSFQVESLSRAIASLGPNRYPSLLYNAMIHPLIPYTIQGAIWYQGESNAGRAYQYRKAFPLMINDWRKRWGQGDFPFYFVQLASFNAANGNSKAGSSWAELREAQTLTLSLPNTGMAVTTDIGNPGDIHPRNKQDVGKRLAAVALHDVYDKDIVAGGPVYQSMEKKGHKAILSFTNIGSGLTVRDKYGYLKGFEIAGADRVFHFAKADVEGDQVVVYHEGVKDPVAVRFGWADDASDNNLFNKEGFPAGPFRTDDWKGITENAKFNPE